MRSFQDMEARANELQQSLHDSGLHLPDGVVISIALWGAGTPLGLIPVRPDGVILVLPEGLEVVRWDRKDDDPMSIQWFAYSSIESVILRPKASWSSQYLTDRGDLRLVSRTTDDPPAIFELRVHSPSGKPEVFSVEANVDRPAVISAMMELRNRWMSA